MLKPVNYTLHILPHQFTSLLNNDKLVLNIWSMMSSLVYKTLCLLHSKTIVNKSAAENLCSHWLCCWKMKSKKHIISKHGCCEKLHLFFFCFLHYKRWPSRVILKSPMLGFPTSTWTYQRIPMIGDQSWTSRFKLYGILWEVVTDNVKYTQFVFSRLTLAKPQI